MVCVVRQRYLNICADFKPETLYQRRQLSRTLSDTAFAWPMVLPTYARSQRLGSAGEALECMLVSEWNMNLLVLLAT